MASQHDPREHELRMLELQIELEKTKLELAKLVPPPAVVPPVPVLAPAFSVKPRAVTRGPKVQRYSEDGVLLKTYPGILEATRDNYFSPDNAPTTGPLKKAAKNRTVYKGFRWATLDREKPDDTVQDIGETTESSIMHSGLIAGLDLTRQRIEKVFCDQKDAAEQLQLNGLGSVSTALKMANDAKPRMTRGLYFRFWRDCSAEMQQDFLSRGTLPEPRQRMGAFRVKATNSLSNESRMFTSMTAVQKELRISRATIFDCAKNGYMTASGYRLEIVP
jgi:hypothetical protein